MAKAVLTKESPLTVNEVIHLLKNCPPVDQCVESAPVDVKGGEVYVFKTNDTDKQGEDILLQISTVIIAIKLSY